MAFSQTIPFAEGFVGYAVRSETMPGTLTAPWFFKHAFLSMFVVVFSKLPRWVTGRVFRHVETYLERLQRITRAMIGGSRVSCVLK